LETIRGVGPSRRKALLKHFGSIDNIRRASLEELKAVVPQAAAEAIKTQLS
jgi:excinuclease ABC subunit C